MSEDQIHDMKSGIGLKSCRAVQGPFKLHSTFLHIEPFRNRLLAVNSATLT